MDGLGHHKMPAEIMDADSASSGSSSSSNSISVPEDNIIKTSSTTTSTFQPPLIDAAAKARVNSGGTSTGITNSGRWSNDEHERFLTGLEQFGTGNWKRITELVGTRSCTQVRTHAQKYFLALQKPPLPDGSASGVATTKAKKPKASSRKKSKLLFEHLDGSGKKKSSNNASAKRGLSGMSLLAQAAMVDQPWQALDQTAEEYEQAHPQSDDESDDDDGDSSGEEDAAPAKKKAKQANGFMTAGQEIAMLRAQLQIANESVGLMKKEVQASEARAVDAIEGRNIAIKECRELQEMNSQLKMEQARILMAIEGNGGKGLAAAATSQPQASAVPSAGLDQMQAMAGLFGPQAAMQAASSQSQQFQQQIQQQDQIVIEVLQSRLKEAEIRYHAVTESLARQTQVLTDQHRAILELNCKLEKERSLRENAEMELGNLKRQAGGK